jgi:hypothetical protein
MTDKFSEHVKKTKESYIMNIGHLDSVHRAAALIEGAYA